MKKMKRKFKLVFGGTHGTILNVDKFTTLKGKLPTDVEVLRRVSIQEQIGIQEPYLLQLTQEEYANFVKEFRQKLPKIGVSHLIKLQDDGRVIVRIDMK